MKGFSVGSGAGCGQCRVTKPRAMAATGGVGLFVVRETKGFSQVEKTLCVEKTAVRDRVVDEVLEERFSEAGIVARQEHEGARPGVSDGGGEVPAGAEHAAE